jgi:hypothetical protein
MALKKNDRRRYFYRVGEREDVVERPQETEVAHSQLPHISVSIPASSYSFFIFGLYSCIVFIILSFSLLSLSVSYPLPDPAAAALISDPRSFPKHHAYLRQLIDLYKLREANAELSFILAAQSRSYFDSFNPALLAEQKQLLLSREQRFHSVVVEYAYWLKAVRDYPSYRDGLYRIAQLDYMMYNTPQARLHLQSAVMLDPRFSLGSSTLTALTSTQNIE